MKFINEVFAEFVKDRCTTLAAALAFYTAFALPPLLYLLLTVMAFALSLLYQNPNAEQQAQTTLENQAAQMLGNQSAADGIRTILETNRQSNNTWWKTLISFSGVIVAATGVVGAMQDSLNQVWQVRPDPKTTNAFTMLSDRMMSLAMILGLGFLLIVSLAISSALSTAGQQIGEFIGINHGFASAANYIVQTGVVFVIFSAIFKFMPDAKIRWRDVLIGAAITTVLFIVGRLSMQIYFAYSQPGAELGSAAASLAIILAWVYYTAMIVLLGAEATQVYAVRFGSGIQPERNAVRIVKSLERSN